MSHTLYRFFDESGALLYVGITGNPAKRLSQHRREKDWWDSVSRVEMQRFASREELEAAERAAVIAEKPLHNVVFNGPNTSSQVKPKVQRETDRAGLVVRFKGRSGREIVTPLHLYYEVDGTSISDDYLPSEISAKELSLEWLLWLRRHEDIPIHAVPVYWYVSGPGIFESASPHNYSQRERNEWFGDFFTQPYAVKDGRPIRIPELPVHRARWTETQGDKGGFLTELMNWTPLPLQRTFDASLVSLAVAA